MTDERKPNEDERPAPLGDWGSSWEAPRELRQSTLEAARRRGLVRGGSMTGRGFWIAAAAAAAVALVVGYGLGARQAGRGGETMTQTQSEATAPAGEAAAAPKYVLFLFEDASYETPAENEIAARVGEYSDWARSLAERGRYVTGEELATGGRFLRVESGAVAASELQRDANRGGLTGYFVIGAANLDEALEVARTCPHLKYHGSVEVRPIQAS